MSLPPKWMRRLLIDPAIVLLVAVAVASLPVWIIVAAFVSRYVPGNWRILRLAWFLFLYLVVEAVGLALMFLGWVGSGFGWKLRSPFFVEAHYRLLGLMLRTVVRSAEVTFKLRVVQDEQRPSTSVEGRTRSILVFSRHAGPGDSFLLMNGLVNGYRRDPRIVLKDFLQWDPAVDVILNRLPTAFVPAGRKGVDALVAAIGDLARTMDRDDAFVIFPEGANYTEGRRGPGDPKAARHRPTRPGRTSGEAEADPAAPLIGCDDRPGRGTGTVRRVLRRPCRSGGVHHRGGHLEGDAHGYRGGGQNLALPGRGHPPS